MKKITIDYERAFRTSMEFEATDEEIESMCRGDMPDSFSSALVEKMENEYRKSDATYEDDYAVNDMDYNEIVGWGY